MTDTPEWHRSDNEYSILLYTLKQDGWHRGEPALVNDLMIRIENANGSTNDLGPIAARILAALTPASAEPVAYQVAMSDGRWGTIFHHPDKPLGDHRPLYAHPAPVTEIPDWIARCCQCNRLVDTRENDEGGDIHGCQMDDGTWVCCGECWEKAAGVAPTPMTVEAAARETALKIMQMEVETFCRRVEAGEIRSKRTYAAFTDCLRALSWEKS